MELTTDNTARKTLLAPDDDAVRQDVDTYARLSQQATQIKAEMDAIKARIERRAVHDLRDTKRKTAEYWGTNNARVTVSRTETVKPITMIPVVGVLGRIADDYAKQELVWRLTEPCKRLLAIVRQGAYTEETLEQVVREITDDPKTQASLRKKLKGKYDRDKATLTAIGLSEAEASDWAYLITEVCNWEWLLQVLKAAGWQGTTQEAINILKAAVTVDEGSKITLTYEE